MLFHRIGLGLLGVALGAGAAVACPTRTACIAPSAPAGFVEVAASPAPMPRQPLKLNLMRAAGLEADVPAMRLSFDSMPEARAIVMDMETFWSQLETSVHSQMPKVERRTVTVTLSPVIVAGQFDTVPGVGVSGDY